MARPKGFDREETLDKAMHLFWTKGYEATSMEDLLGAMEIGRQSLYDTFGDKRALFLAALERYQDLLDGFLRSCLADTTSVKAALRRLFDDTIAEPHERKRKGCLMVNTAVELAPHDPEAARRVADSQRASERIFVRALEHARDRGELAPGADVRALGRFLMTVLQGLRVAAKADPSPARLRDIADVAMRALE